MDVLELMLTGGLVLLAAVCGVWVFARMRLARLRREEAEEAARRSREIDDWVRRSMVRRNMVRRTLIEEQKRRATAFRDEWISPPPLRAVQANSAPIHYHDIITPGLVMFPSGRPAEETDPGWRPMGGGCGGAGASGSFDDTSTSSDSSSSDSGSSSGGET